jgi:hypothetical protein
MTLLVTKTGQREGTGTTRSGRIRKIGPPQGQKNANETILKRCFCYPDSVGKQLCE